MRQRFDGDEGEGFTVNYDFKLILKTSFTGKDMLTSVLRAGNFGGSVWDEGHFR